MWQLLGGDSGRGGRGYSSNIWSLFTRARVWRSVSGPRVCMVFIFEKRRNAN